MTAKPLVFCALDTADLARALELARSVGPVTGGLKLGLEFFNTFGPPGVEKVREAAPGAALFLDLKFHDIPSTVAAAVKTVSANLAPAYLNVHASGGFEMLAAAKDACAAGTKLLAVTVLTSLDDDALKAIGFSLPPYDLATKLALAAVESGLDGVVCSAHEIEMIRRICGKDLVLMVPGIRPAGGARENAPENAMGDQKRVMAPKEALQKGATHLVIGRPITRSKNPAKAARDILDGLGL